MAERLDSKFRTLMTLSDQLDKAEAEFKSAKEEFQGYQAELWDELEDQGLKSYKADLGAPWGVMQFVPNRTIRSRILSADALAEWARAEGRYDELFKPDVRKAVLNEEIRDRLEDKRELPPGADFSETRFFTKTRKRA